MKRTASLLSLFLSCILLSAQMLTKDVIQIGNNLCDAINEGRQADAARLADIYLSYCTSDQYRYGRFYAEAKHAKAHAAAAGKDFAGAQQLMDEVITAWLDKRVTSDYDRVGDAYFDRSSYHIQLLNTDQAIADMMSAAESYKKANRLGKYATALCQSAQFYKFRDKPGDDELEAECYEKAFPNVEKGTPEHLAVAAAMIQAYNSRGKYSKANNLGKQLKKSAQKVRERQPIQYADFLLSMSVAEMNTKQFSQALADAEEARTVYENEQHTADHNYAILLKATADCHFHMQHYQEALSLYEQASPLLLKAEGENGRIYQGCSLQLIETYAIIHPEKAHELLHKQQEQLFVGTNDTTTLEYATMLAKQARMSADLGNYSEAAAWCERALRRHEARGDSLQIALMLYELSNYCTHQGQQQRADSLTALSLELSHRRGFTQTEAEALHQQAISHYRKKDYQQAAGSCRQALALLHQSGMAASTEYASILSNYALFQFALDSIANAVQFTRRALDMQTSILGAEHGDNAMLLFNLARYHHRLGQMDSVALYYHRAITLQTQLVRNNFSFQSTRQREHYWQRKSYLFQAAPIFASTPEQAPPELLKDIYDAQLFTKGILLNSEADFRRILQKEATADVLAQYDELQATRAELYEMQQGHDAKASEGEDRLAALQHRIGQLEYAIVKQCKAYGDFTQNLSLTSDSVRRSLRPGEAAIEFLEANVIYGGQADRLYLALVLRPEWDAPHACRLFLRSDMEELGYPDGSVGELLAKAEWQNKIYSDGRLGKLIWGNLIPELQGATDVYFTPTGIFYQWGIEYMPVGQDGTTHISDSLNLYRLSSTKMLAQRNNSPATLNGSSAVIYSGLDYENMTIAQMREYHEMGNDEAEDDEDFLAMLELSSDQQEADSLSILAMAERGTSVRNLSGAKEEGEAIARILFNAGIPFEHYNLFSGTEESFKALSGQNISLLHIATHGFSYPVSEQSNPQLDWLNPAAQAGRRPTDPLSYSGLLFSGCNNKLQHPYDFPTDIDDGILTAQEISQLNLQHLQLTVLSACQTGTGMLQEDGVFGVQRGFKKAGAHTLVMSLWSVNDAATKTMMTTFYEGLLSGLSRHDAFQKAQAAVRAQQPEPHFWAPFIMLDDI